MKMNKLTTLLYLAGIVFLVLAAKSWRENRSVPKFYIMVNEKFDSILQSYGNSKDQRQIILFDNNSQTIFFRSHLKKGKMSSDSTKESMLSEAKKSLQPINSK